MKKFQNFYLPFCFLVFVAPRITIAQNTTETQSIYARGAFIENECILRWAPENFELWKNGNAFGYKVERITFKVEGRYLSKSEREVSYLLLAEVLTPWPESAWEGFSELNEFAGVAASSIYGDSLEILPAGGASLLNVYNKTREKDNRFGFSLMAADMDFDVAIALGLAFKDTIIDNNTSYLYTITMVNPPDGQTPQALAVISTDSLYDLPIPEGLTGLGSDRTAILQWDFNQQEHVGYYVERQNLTSGIWTRVNELPIVIGNSELSDGKYVSYVDSLPSNDVDYGYRSIAISPFGILSNPSDTIHLKGIEAPYKFNMHFDSVKELQSGKLTLYWTFPDSLEAKMSRFDIWRSNTISSPGSKINESLIKMKSRTYVDPSPEPESYYTLRVYDLKGREYASFPKLGQIKDETPPTPPVILNAVCTSDGVAKITWKRNTEPDMMGYRVYLSNVGTGDYSQITSTWINDTLFRYSIGINTLSEDVYFTVRALDKRQNQSAMSTPFKAKRADIIPPSPPVITHAVAGPNKVQFEWTLSTSLDVASDELQRRDLSGPTWDVVYAFPHGTPVYAYNDASANPRRWYEYRLVAIDDANLRSSSKVFKIKPVDNGYRPPIQSFTGAYGPAVKTVTLTWQYPADVDLIGFEVFRANADSNNLRSYGFVPIPLQNSANPGMGWTGALSGANWSMTFIDKDLNFAIPQINAFNNLSSGNINPNSSVPTPGNDGNFSAPGPNNMSGSGGGAPNMVYYWVMAKYANGAFSPLTWALGVGL